MIQHELTGGLKNHVPSVTSGPFLGGGGAGQAFTQHYSCSINILRLHLQRRVWTHGAFGLSRTQTPP